MAQILLVRHGQASFGAADYDHLSELGVEQSRMLGEWLDRCGQQFDRVITGGLRRHRQTAAACLGAMAAAPAEAEWIDDPGLEEYDHVQLFDAARPELRDPAAMKAYLAQTDDPRRAVQHLFEEAMQRWMSGRHDHEYRETWSGFRKRCVGALQRLLADAEPAKNAVVFTSGGPISAIVQELLGLTDPRTAALNWTVVNSSVTRLLHSRGRVSLSYYNNFAHLESSGRPKTITYR